MAASPPLLHFPPSLPLIPFNIPIAQDRHCEALEVLEIEMGRECGLSNEPPQPPSESQGSLQAGEGGRNGTGAAGWAHRLLVVPTVMALSPDTMPLSPTHTAASR